MKAVKGNCKVPFLIGGYFCPWRRNGERGEKRGTGLPAMLVVCRRVGRSRGRQKGVACERFNSLYFSRRVNRAPYSL